MQGNPYSGLPADQFWSSGVVALGERASGVRPAGLALTEDATLAAFGPCFAQSCARLKQQWAGVAALRLDQLGTPRALRQLLLAAYGLHRPQIAAWVREDGRFVDVFRPEAFADGFESEAELRAARRQDLLALRGVLEAAQLVVVSLGQSEAWVAADGSVLPMHPGMLNIEPAEGAPELHNFTAAEMRADLSGFIEDLRVVNPGVAVVLSVSAEPLAATASGRPVLIADGYSKAALRVAAAEVEAPAEGVHYFPALELMRGVGVGMGRVMEIFGDEFLK